MVEIILESMNFPAFCDNPACGTVFASGFAFNNATNVALTGNKSGPFPKCGSTGHIPDGVFNFVGNSIEILSAPEGTIREISIFSQIVREAYEQKLSSEVVAERIQREVPAFSGIAAIFPKTRGGRYSFLALLVAVAGFVYGQKSNNIEQNITVNQVLGQMYINF